MSEIKHIFFFRPSLKTHVDLYLSWTDILKSFCSSTVITFLDPKSFSEQKKLAIFYKQKGIKVIKLPKLFHDFAIFIFVFYACLKYKKVIVHLKKRKSVLLWQLRKVSPKLKIYTDYEGDPFYEKDYLENNPSPSSHYSNEIIALSNEIEYQNKYFKKFDGIHLASPEMKEYYSNKFKHKNLECIPTGFNEANFFPDLNARDSVRNALGINPQEKVFIYAGNLFYSWQNIEEVCSLFKSFQVKFNSKLLILTRLEDFSIANYFCRKFDLEEGKFIVKNVENRYMNSYLNAADFGILLRKKHPMNLYCSPGKVGEYLCSGLKIIFTKNVGFYSKLLENQRFCLFAEDITSESLNKFYSQEISREEIRDWSIKNISNNTFKDSLLRSVING